MKTLGIPRALYYSYYKDFFNTLFKEIGFEVLLSDETNKKIVQQGTRYSVPEICAPIKLYCGHVINLLEKDVDGIFVPRFVSIRKPDHFCPKIMGLPDLVFHSVPAVQDKLITVDIEVEKENIGNYKTYEDLRERLGIDKSRFKKSINQARLAWKASRDKELKKGKTEKENGKLHVALMGYGYIVHDHYLSMNITGKLSRLGVNHTTFEMVEDEDIYNETKKLDKQLFWTFSNKVLGAGLHLLRNKCVDGFIYLSTFGCGPDAFLEKLFEYETEEHDTPFLTLNVDEHSGENHLVTRLEAFVDMLHRKRKGE
ncbi:MAG: acyl-CoA dehydratase activase-related protein [Thermotogota bacterium]